MLFEAPRCLESSMSSLHVLPCGRLPRCRVVRGRASLANKALQVATSCGKTTLIVTMTSRSALPLPAPCLDRSAAFASKFANALKFASCRRVRALRPAMVALRGSGFIYSTWARVPMQSDLRKWDRSLAGTVQMPPMPITHKRWRTIALQQGCWLLADAEARKDFSQQIIRRHGPGDLSEPLLCEPQLLGNELAGSTLGEQRDRLL